MKKTLILLGFMGLFISCQQTDPEKEKMAVQSAITEFYSAMEKFDYEALKNWTTPEFSGFEDGFMYNNINQFTDVLKSFEGFTVKTNVNFVKTEVFGNMATVVVEFGAILNKGAVNVAVKTYENYIMKKTDQKWQLHYFHVTHLPDENDKSFTSIHLLQIQDNELLKQFNTVFEKANSMIMSMGYVDCGYKLLTTVSDNTPKYNYVLIASWKNQETYKAIHESEDFKKLGEESAAILTDAFKNEVYVKAILP